VGAGGVAVTLGVLALAGCGARSELSGAQSDAGKPSMDASESTTDATPHSTVDASSPPEDVLAQCGITMVSDPGNLPAPIAWRACDSPVAFPCEQMDANWPGAAPSVQVIPIGAHADLTGGRTTLFFRRFQTNGAVYDAIAEADGPMLQAFYGEGVDDGKCWALSADLRDGKFAVGLSSRTGPWDHVQERCAVIGGTVGASTPAGQYGKFGYHDPPVSCGDAAAVGSQGLSALVDKSPLLDWSFHEISSRPFWVYRWIDGNVFGGFAKVAVAPIGQPPTLDYAPSTALRQIYAADADGASFAWTEGHTWVSDVNEWCSTPDVLMTAPYTSQWGSFAPRAVVTLGPCSNTSVIRVGCGYAALDAHLPGTRTQATVIVRIADGRWWPLSSAQGELSLSTIVDISCSHVYARASSPTHAGAFVRIPLSQLGPGNPP
jgi:hypothetical protein